MPTPKYYQITLPSGSSQIWDQEKVDRNKKWLDEKKATTAEVNSFNVTLPSGSSQTWDADKYGRNINWINEHGATVKGSWIGAQQPSGPVGPSAAPPAAKKDPFKPTMELEGAMYTAAPAPLHEGGSVPVPERREVTPEQRSDIQAKVAIGEKVLQRPGKPKETPLPVSSKVAFSEGNEYQLTTKNGDRIPVMLYPDADGVVDNGDGTVNVVVNRAEVDGEPVVSQMSKVEFQQMYDRTLGSETKDAEKMRGKATRDQVRLLSEDIDARLNDLAGTASGRFSDMVGKESVLERLNRIMPLTSGGPGPMSMPSTADPFNTLSQAEKHDYYTLQAAQRSVRDASRIIAEADHNAQEGTFGKWIESSFAGGAARGFGQKFFDIDNWDMGVSDVKDGAALIAALDAFDKGEPLTEAQQMLLDAKAVELATNAYFGSYVGRGYKAGSVTAESIPFMIEMCINPASSIGNAATNKMARYAIKRFGKQAAKKGIHRVLRGAGRVGADLAGATLMAGTTGLAGIAGETMERMAGLNEGSVGYDNEGRSVFTGIRDGEDPATAFAKSFGSRVIENYSEMFGEYFAPIIGGAGKIARGGLEKIHLGKVVDFLDDVNGSDLAKMVNDFEKHARWNGPISEYAEEVAGGVMNALLIGDQTLDADPETGVFNLDNNIDTFLGVGLMGGAFSAIKTPFYRTAKYRTKKELDRMDSAGKATFRNLKDWKDFTSRFAQDPNAALHDVLVGDHTQEERQAALQYAKASMEYQGALATEEKRDVSPEQRDAETSFDNGYSLTEPQEMHDAKVALQARRAALKDAFGEEDINLDELNIEQGEEGWTPEQKAIAMDYINAKATYEGMIQRVKDDIGSQTDEAFAEIDRNTNSDMDSLIPVTMADGRQGYIVRGNIVLGEDGRIDKSQSDKAIIVRDAETGDAEWSTPALVMETAGILDPQAEKEAAAARIGEQVAQAEADKIDGTMQFSEGESRQVVTPDGQLAQMTVTPNDKGVVENEDGTVNVAISSPDGSTRMETMTREEIGQAVDAADAVRLAEYDASRVAKDQEQVARDEEALAPYAAIPRGADVKVHWETGDATYRFEGARLDEDGQVVFDAVDPENEEAGAIEIPASEVTNMKDLLGVQPEPADSEMETVEETPVQTPAVPVSEYGIKQYQQAPVEATYQDIYTDPAFETPEEAAGFVDGKIRRTEAALAEAEKALAAIHPEDFDVPADYKAARDAALLPVEAARQALDYWNAVRNYAEQQAAAPATVPATATAQETNEERVKAELEKVGVKVMDDVSSLDRGAVKPGEVYASITTDKDGFVKVSFKRVSVNSKGETIIGTFSGPQFTSLVGEDLFGDEYDGEELGDLDLSSAQLLRLVISPDGRMSAKVALRDKDGTSAGQWDTLVLKNNPLDFLGDQLTAREQEAIEKGKAPVNAAETVEESPVAEGTASENPVVQAINDAAAQVDTNPTDAQKEAGNYRKGHVTVDGYDISIENPKGSVRSGRDSSGKEWSVTMNNNYGYIRRTEGVDGDHIDVFLSDNPTEGKVFVIDQVKPDGSFDEHKVMYGFNSAEEAKAAYLANYSPGWNGLGAISEVSKEEFKKWIDSSRRKTKPFAEYRTVDKDGVQRGGIDLDREAAEAVAFTTGRTAEEVAAEREEARQKPLIERAKQWDDRIGPMVEVLTSIDQVTNRAALKAIRNGEEPTGWYNPKTKKPVIYLPNVKDVSEIDKAYMHEVISHKGLRELLHDEETGDENFNRLMDDVWEKLMKKKDREFFLNYNSHLTETEAFRNLSASDPEAAAQYLRRAAADEYTAHLAEDVNENPSAWEMIADWIRETLRGWGIKLSISKGELRDLIRDSLANYERQRQSEKARRQLDDHGIAATNDEVRFFVRYVPKKEEIDGIAKDIAKQVGVSKAEAKRWVQSETSLAAIILSEDYAPFLDYTADDRYQAIKQDSDYPQGTVDFNNICRKRIPFTQMYQRIQKAFPNVIITGADLAKIRNIMKSRGITVACGLCYVEDRRQLLGEIAKDFIDAVADDFQGYASRGGSDQKRKNAEKFRSLIGEDRKADLSIYDLITLDGAARLSSEHPGIYKAFQAFNAARGQQAGNLFQGYAEYKREILKWNKKKVQSVNDNGGLRVFSYSDFEAHHLIDLVQIIQDCARKGVKIQGYTKVPAFARAVAETGIKLNRSLIPLGDTGIVDGKLAYDPVEGIDVNDKDFLQGNDNIGNILIGINDEQIRLAMADPFVNYIIPYHSNQSGELRTMKQTGAWKNYKYEQTDYDIATGKSVGHGVNIYTDVLGAAEKEGKPIRTERQFVERFLQVCKERGWRPRFDRFLDKDKNGEYVFTPGYYKFLVDFKLFDEKGRILPQVPVKAKFDDDFNRSIHENYVADEKEKQGADLGDLYDEIVTELDLDKRAALDGGPILFSKRGTGSDADYENAIRRGDVARAKEMVRDAADRAFPDTVVKGADGHVVPVYHQTNSKVYINRETGQDWESLDWRERDAWDERDDWDEHWEEKDFYTFDRRNARTTIEMPAFFFSPENDPYHEYGKRTIEAYINLKNPAIDPLIPDAGRYDGAGARAMEELIRQGHDGFIRTEDGKIREYGVFNANQIKSAEAVTRDNDGRIIPLSERFNEREEDIRFRKANQNQLGLVSNAEAALDRIKMEKATPEQWVKMLEKEGGLKAGEDKWIGLSDWLKSQNKKSITKDEIADYISKNRIQIEEVRYSENGQMTDEELDDIFNNGLPPALDDFHTKLQNEFDDLLEEMNAEEAYEKMAEKYGERFREAYDKDDVVDGESLQWTYVGSLMELAGFANGGESNSDRSINATRLTFTTKGLENKREIALTIPTIEPWNQGDDIHFGDAGEGRAIAWARFGDSVDEKGNGVLVIDEIQSKRHQEGREKGYLDKKAVDDAYRKVNEASDEFKDTVRDIFGTRWTDAIDDNGDVKDSFLENMSAADIARILDAQFKRSQARRAYDEIRGNYEVATETGSAIPAAPFEKNWHELAMKRMLRLAAEEGYDYVAWTTGEQQAERYKIGSVVKKVSAGMDQSRRRHTILNIDANGMSGITTLSHDDDGNITNVSGSNTELFVDAKNIADVVGKEMAVDILMISEPGTANMKEYTGNDLRVGAEGMKGFYDDILPRFMNKYGKKWGVKVSDITLPNVEEAGRTMHAVPVTDEMKESVLEGQTMFRKSPSANSEAAIAGSLYDRYENQDGLDYPWMSEKELIDRIEEELPHGVSTRNIFAKIDEYRRLDQEDFDEGRRDFSGSDRDSVFEEILSGLERLAEDDGATRFRKVPLNRETIEEMESIKAVAFTNGRLGLAPNGKPSRLSEENWALVRTAAFKRWFGDWEFAARLVRFVDVSEKHPFNLAQKEKDAVNEIVDYATKNGIVKTLSDEDTGGKGIIDISRNSISKMAGDAYKYGDDAKRDIHLNALLKLHDIILESVLGEAHASQNKGKDGARRPENGTNSDLTILRYYGAINVNGIPYRTKTTVRRTESSGKQKAYTYEITEIELLDGISVVDESDNPASNNSITVANLLKGVKKYNSSEEILDFSKVVDENGEPLVVYHGTPSTFFEFNPGYVDEAAELGSGFYFTDDREFAESYTRPNGDNQPYIDGLIDEYLSEHPGSSVEEAEKIAVSRGFANARVMPVFLNIRNPFYTDGSEKTAEEYNEILGRGYDGVIDEHFFDRHGKDFDGIAPDIRQYLAVNPAQVKSAEDNTGGFDPGNDDIRFRRRTKPAPKKTGIGYKVFYQKDGKLYPPMVANPGGADTPVGVWLDADAGEVVATSKTGRKKVKAGGKGTQGGSGTLAYRPGWHLGTIPYALQFNRGEKVDNPLGIKNQKGEVIKVGRYFPKDFVWAEVEYAADKDYQDEAMSYGYNEAGNFQHSLAGLPRVPEDGFYSYRTNANPATDPWIITGAMKVNRILTRDEVDELVRRAGREPQAVEGDDIRFSKTVGPRSVPPLRRPAPAPEMAPAALVRKVEGGGLRAILGDERTKEFYESVYQVATPEEVQALAEKANEPGYDLFRAVKEYLADLAEKGFESDDTGMLRNAAFRLSLQIDSEGNIGDNVLQYILWRNGRRYNRNDQVAEAANVNMKVRLKVGEYAGETLADKTGKGVSTVDAETKEARAKLAREKKAAVKKMPKTSADLLQKVTKAMSAQREYDRATVDSITALAKTLINEGGIDSVSAREMGRLMSIVSKATGKATLQRSADQLVDFMARHILKTETDALVKMTKVKASKEKQPGVDVQDKLDPEGQLIVKALKDGMVLPVEAIDRRMAELQDKRDNGKLARMEADAEIAGLTLAREYAEKVVGSEQEEEELKQAVKDARFDKQMTPKTYREFAVSTEKAILENVIERIQALRDIRARLADVIAASGERAVLWNQKEQERVDEIRHDANRDLEGMPAEEQGHEKSTWDKLKESSLVQFFAAPLGTFDQMLRFLGRKSPDGRGYLFNRYMAGWTRSASEEWNGIVEADAILDEKVREVFGDEVSRWSDLYRVERAIDREHAKKAGAKHTLKFWDGTKMVEKELSSGNLLYIYMVDKMVDGQMKLRRMGITEEDVDRIKQELDPRFIALADWIQEDFLVERRLKYDETHRRMFGSSMASIDNYFPLRVLANAREREEEVGGQPEGQQMPSKFTGSIIKRRRNSLALDIVGSDAFSVTVEHIREMERWSAWAEFKRDLGTLLSYRRFRNQLENMSTVYGSGKEMFNNFKKVCEIAAGEYRPEGRGAIDKTVTNLVRGVSSAKVSFRVFTALKQTLSLPAFLADARVDLLAKSMVTPGRSWKWCMENLPVFQKRWKSRQAGNEKLQDTELDWKYWRTHFMQLASRFGMSPNAFVDALTVSVGSYAVYQTRLQQYLKDGYTQEKAEEKAKQDATVSFNESQQSSEGAFLSALQSDRTVVANALSVFRNSSFGYGRRFWAGLRSIGRMLKPGYAEESVEFLRKQFIDDGIEPEQAERAAERAYRRAFGRALADMAVFGFGVQFAWNLGPYAVYMLLGGGGDDDRWWNGKKEEDMTDAVMHALAGGWSEGLAGGSIVSEMVNMARKGDSFRSYDPTLLPALSDIKRLAKNFENDKVAGAVDVANLLVQSGFGFNPETFTDIYASLYDACNGDLGLAKESLIAAMRILQVPQSQVDQFLLDELDLTGEEYDDVTLPALAERYARYQIRRAAPGVSGMYDEAMQKKLEDKYIKRFMDKAKEARKVRGSGFDREFLTYLDEDYKETKAELQDLKDNAAIDPEGYAAALDEFYSSPEFAQYKLADLIKKTRKGIEKAEKGSRNRTELIKNLNDYKKEFLDSQAALKDKQNK